MDCVGFTETAVVADSNNDRGGLIAIVIRLDRDRGFSGCKEQFYHLSVAAHKGSDVVILKIPVPFEGRFIPKYGPIISIAGGPSSIHVWIITFGP